MKLAQQRFIEINPILPVLSTIRFMAHRRYGRWIGGAFLGSGMARHNLQARCRYMQFLEFLNIHPTGYETPSDANFRCGVLQFFGGKILNPLYGPLGSSHHCSETLLNAPL
ncbi:MAG: hypothetical protein QXK93_07785 [Candidatus Bathyarchaeia archaeon]